MCVLPDSGSDQNGTSDSGYWELLSQAASPDKRDVLVVGGLAVAGLASQRDCLSGKSVERKVKGKAV